MNIICLSLIIVFNTAPTLECNIEIAKEPATSIECNPFNGRTRMRLICMAFFHGPARAIQLVNRANFFWFFESLNGDVTSLTPNSAIVPVRDVRVQLQTMDRSRYIQSTLFLGFLKYPDQAGQYYCQLAHNNIIYMPSSILTLSENNNLSKVFCRKSDSLYTRDVSRCVSLEMDSNNNSIVTEKEPGLADEWRRNKTVNTVNNITTHEIITTSLPGSNVVIAGITQQIIIFSSVSAVAVVCAVIISVSMGVFIGKKYFWKPRSIPDEVKTYDNNQTYGVVRPTGCINHVENESSVNSIYESIEDYVEYL